MSLTETRPQERIAPEKSKNADAKAKILSHEEAQSLQDYARARYKRAFELLKDK